MEDLIQRVCKQMGIDPDLPALPAVDPKCVLRFFRSLPLLERRVLWMNKAKRKNHLEIAAALDMEPQDVIEVLVDVLVRARHALFSGKDGGP